jgi:hypothetical protein
MSILQNKFGVSERTVRKWIERLGFSSFKQIENEEIRQGKLRAYDPKKKYYIITWAQNATPVHGELWKNILAYANRLDANVGVIQGRYQNPTSLWTKNMEGEEWWDEPLQLYLDGGRHNIHSYLDILSDIKVKPTAVNPLTGFEGVSGNRSSILGHPRVHLRSLPVLKGHVSKLLMTTGACTIKNYTDTKAGKKAEFHHTYGFVIVEIKDNLTYYVRQVTASDDGSFIDLNSEYVNGERTEVTECSAYVLGDIHAAKVNHEVMKETFKFFDKITPKRIVIHDVFDGESVNHHEAKNPIKAYHRYKEGKNLVKKEVDHMIGLIDQYNMTRYDPIVIRSNHDQWLDKWIAEEDWKKDVANAVEYMEYSLALLKGQAPKGLIPYILDNHYKDGITTLDLDDPFKINGWEVGQHGHLGKNGSRGNIEQYRKLNTKIITGHAHTPERRDGAVQVGTYTELRMGYNHGPSSWMHSGAILNKNGKVQQLLFAEDYKFTTLL